MRHQSRLATLAATAALAFAACGGGSDTADSTVPTTPEEASTTTSTPDEQSSTTSTSAPTTTAAPNTTTTTVQTTTTTVPAPPTTVPVEDAVASAAVESQIAYLYAVYNVDAPDAIDRLMQTSTADALDVGMRNYQQIVDNGWRVRENPDVPDRTVIASPVEIVDPTTAQVTICNVGAGVVYAPGAADDGADIVINDLIDVSLLRVTMVLDDEVWKLSSGETIEELEGPEACDEF